MNNIDQVRKWLVGQLGNDKTRTALKLETSISGSMEYNSLCMADHHKTKKHFNTLVGVSLVFCSTTGES